MEMLASGGLKPNRGFDRVTPDPGWKAGSIGGKVRHEYYLE